MKNGARNLLLLVVSNRWIQHLAFWGLSYYILFNHFASSSEPGLIDHIYTAVFMISLLTICYLNLFLLIPRFLQKGNYFRYLLLLVLVIFLGIEINVFSFNYLVDFLFPDYLIISYIDRYELSKYMIVFLSLTTLFHLSKSWFLLKESETRLIKLEKEKYEAELMALKSQVNPHFLFNSLNSIYSLVIKKSDLAKEALIKLSDSLRYMIYESTGEKIPLKREIEYLDNYIELQKLRTPHGEFIQFRIDGDPGNLQIAPLLLIPIVENGFKHGIKAEIKDVFINIRIIINGSELTLMVSNNKSSEKNDSGDEIGGIGLENMGKRLELLYDQKYQLDIEEQADKFDIKLKLHLD
jgi:hypothetical protein